MSKKYFIFLFLMALPFLLLGCVRSSEVCGQESVGYGDCIKGVLFPTDADAPMTLSKVDDRLESEVLLNKIIECFGDRVVLSRLRSDIDMIYDDNRLTDDSVALLVVAYLDCKYYKRDRGKELLFLYMYDSDLIVSNNAMVLALRLSINEGDVQLREEVVTEVQDYFRWRHQGLGGENTADPE